MIVLDTLRWNHLGCYGYGLPTSPNIDALASSGMRFDRCYATDVPTIPSFSAVLSGQRGIKTGRVSFSPTENISWNVGWLPYLLSGTGKTTCMVSTLNHMGGYFNRGFQYYLNPMAGLRPRTQTVEAEEINAYAIPWLEQHRDDDFFLFVHYWDPHVESVWGGGRQSPRYKAHEPYKSDFWKKPITDTDEREYVISQYDANIAYADAEIGELIETIDRLGLSDDTAVLLTTDHGENLGETHPEGKDLWDHLDIYEPCIHIPLILRHPSLGSGTACEELVENIDYAPTICSMLDVEPHEQFDGVNLLDTATGKTESRSFVISETGFQTCKRAIITDNNRKLIKTVDNGNYEDAPFTELFDLTDDPEESKNLAETRTDETKDLEHTLDRWVEGQLGNRPDPLRLRAGMGVVGREVPYYSTIFVPR